MFHKMLDNASTRDVVDVLLKSIGHGDVQRGDMLAASELDLKP